MSPTSDIQGSLLDFALSCGIGVTVFRAGTSTTDTPFVYCMGLIFKKGQDYKIVAYDLLSGNVSTNRKLQNISEWVGWVNLVTNTDLNPEVYIVPRPSDNSNFTFGNRTFQVYVRKSGKVVTIQLNISASMASVSDFVTAFTIPQKYNPLSDVIVNYTIQNANKSMILFITKNGEVKFSNLNSAIDDWLCRQCVTYVTN